MCRVVSVACSTAFIEDRIVAVRELAEKADSFIKRRLLALAGKYERQLSPAAPSNALRKIHTPTTFTARPAKRMNRVRRMVWPPGLGFS